MTLALRALIDRAAPLLGGARDPIGLFVGGDRVCAAQMQRTASGLALSAVASLELGGPWYALLCEPRRFRHTLKSLWADHGFRGADVFAAMPQEQLRVFTLEYTVAPGQSDAEVIANETRERLKGKSASTVLDFVPVRQPHPDERQKEAVVAAAGREDVVAFLDFLDAAGVTVRALDISAMALRRVVPWAGRGAEPAIQNLLLVHVGTEASQLMLVWGRRLMLDRAIEFSEQRLVSRVARMLDMPEHAARRVLADESSREAADAPKLNGVLREILGGELLALKTEVQRTLDYAAAKTRGHGVDRILLVGALARFPGIVEFLNQALGKPVEILDPLRLFPHQLSGERVRALQGDCGVAVAIGLALRGPPAS